MASALDALAWTSSDGAAAALDAADASLHPAYAALLGVGAARQSLRDEADALREGTQFQYALALGVDDALQELYEALAAVEDDLLNDPALSAHHVRAALSRWVVGLPPVARVVVALRARDVRGGQLMDELHAAAQDGNPSVALLFSALLFRVRQPFFAVLARWLATAELPEDEGAAADFFVVAAGSGSQPSIVGSNIVEGAVRLGGEGSERLPGLAALASEEEGGAEGGERGAAVVGHPAVTAAALCLRESNVEREWARLYVLSPSRIPSSLMPRALAEVVLAVGKAVRLLVSSGGGGAEEAGAEGAVHAFGPEDSAAVMTLLGALRSQRQYSLLDVTAILHRIRDTVYARLWARVVRGARLPEHVRALRSYLLLGRGDLFAAFLERAAPLLAVLPATAPGALSAVREGPWAAAAAAVGLGAEFLPVEGEEEGEGGRGEEAEERERGGSGAGDAARFSRASLRLFHRCLRFESPIASGPGEDGRGVGEAAGSVISGGASQAGRSHTGRSWAEAVAPPHGHSPSAAIFRAWNAATSPAGEALAAAPRAAARLLLVGSTRLCSLRCDTLDPSALTGGEASSVYSLRSRDSHPLDRTAVLPSPGGVGHCFTCPRVVLAPPAPQRGMPGAAWLEQPIHAAGGFVARFVLALLLPAAAAPPASPPSSLASDTLSFAVVMHRDIQQSLGDGLDAPKQSAMPGAGINGIANSVAVVLVCRRTGGGGGDGDAFRIVAAAYGPPSEGTGNTQSATAIGRDLIAPAAVADVRIASEALCSGAGRAASALYPLHVSVEYVPGGKVPGRLKVSLLVAGVARAAAVPRAGLIPGETLSSPALLPRLLVDAPLALEEALPQALPLGTGSSAGRGRVWLGLTSETPGAPDGPCVALEGLDVASVSEEDSGWAGLHPHYALPWPLHTVLSPSVLAVATDLARFSLRIRAAAHGLSTVWRMLADACAWGGEDGPLSAVSAGVSAQMTGRGGKRRRDPAALARIEARRVLQDSLRPLFVLRARLAFVVDALAYHVQVDVSAAAAAAYETAVFAARDFPALRRAGEGLAADLGSGIFMSKPAAHACLLRLLGHAEAFVRRVRGEGGTGRGRLAALAAALSGGAEASEGGRALASLADAFAADVRFFESVSGSLIAARGGDGLSLASRLNFNGFFVEQE
jgi:hypothetical protein